MNMPARRRSRKKKTTRRKKQGVSLIGVAETVALLNVASETMFNNNVYDFIMGTSGAASGTYRLTLKELLGGLGPESSRVYAPTASGNNHSATYMGVVGHNIKSNWVKGATGMIVIPLAFKMGKNLARPAISRTNRLLNKSGVGSTVKL